jgi:hypothetical protein
MSCYFDYDMQLQRISSWRQLRALGRVVLKTVSIKSTTLLIHLRVHLKVSSGFLVQILHISLALNHQNVALSLILLCPGSFVML